MKSVYSINEKEPNILNFKEEVISIYKSIFLKVFNAVPNDGNKVDVHDLVIKSLYVDLVDKVETINYLYKVGVTNNIGMIFRSFLEVYMYLSFILEKNTKERGRACFYWQKYVTVKNLKNKFNHLSASEKEEYVNEINDTLQKRNNSAYQDLDSYELYITEKINNCFTNPMKLSKRRNWFNEDGEHQNIRSLFEYMGKESEYDDFYSRYSASSHGLSVLGQISVSPQMLAIRPFDDKSIILPMLNGKIFDITNKVIAYYQLNEVLNLDVQKIKNIIQNS